MNAAPLLYRLRPAGILDVIGPDREAFLQGQLTQDVRLAGPGVVLPAAGLSPKGKLLFVAKLAGGSDRFRLIVPAALRDRVRAHLAKYAVFQKVSIEDRTQELARIGILGRPAPAGDDLDGVDLLGPEGEFTEEFLVPEPSKARVLERLRAGGGREIDEREAEVFRVDAGRPRYGQDFDDSNLPDEVGLDAAISATKGCYVGQEIVARMRTYGRVNRRLVGFLFPDGPVSAGSRLDRPGGDPHARVEPGRVTTSVESPRRGAIGLGWAFHDVALGEELVASGEPGGGERRRAIPAGLPFA